MGILDDLDVDEKQCRDSERDARVLDDALEILARYEHQKHSVLNAAASSADVLEKARAVVEVSSKAEPSKFIEAQDRAAVTRAASLAGALLAPEVSPVTELRP